MRRFFIHKPSQSITLQSDRINGCGHVRNDSLNQLEATDRLAELLPLLRILHNGFKTTSGHANTTHCNHEAGHINAVEHISEAHSYLADNVLLSHLTITKS